MFKKLIKQVIRARIATEIYIHGLVLADGSISEVGPVDAVKHADWLLKELYKNT